MSAEKNNKINDDMLDEVNGGGGSSGEHKYNGRVGELMQKHGGVQEENNSVSSKTRNSAAPKSNKKAKKVTLR